MTGFRSRYIIQRIGKVAESIKKTHKMNTSTALLTRTCRIKCKKRKYKKCVLPKPSKLIIE